MFKITSRNFRNTVTYLPYMKTMSLKPYKQILVFMCFKFSIQCNLFASYIKKKIILLSSAFINPLLHKGCLRQHVQNATKL